MRKKILLAVISLVILLGGCFGKDDDKKEAGKKIEGFHSYETEEFRTQVPDGWETLTPQNLPNSKNILAAFRNNVRNPLFTANVVIVKNELSSEASPEDYAKVLAEKLKNSLSSYREIQIESPFYHVEGRDRPDEDLKRFIQISAIREKTAYTVLGSYLATEKEDLAKKIETVVREFEMK